MRYNDNTLSWVYAARSQVRFLYLLIMLLVSAPAGAQVKTDDSVDPYFVETRDTFSKYGPRTITRSVLQDRNGTYWFATWQGIMCYDGKVFTNITLKEGLKHFHVFSIFEDRSGDIWFGTIRGGLYRYHPSSVTGTSGGSFKLFTTKDGLVDNSVTCMAQDVKGHIWFGTSAGATRYDGKTFENFNARNGLAEADINAMMTDSKGTLWVATHKSIYVFNGQSFAQVSNHLGGLYKNIRCLLEDKDGHIWMGGEDGVKRYDPLAKEHVDLLAHPTSYMIQDKAGDIWLSAAEPVAQGTPGSSSYSSFLYRYNGRSFTKVGASNLIFGIIEDNANYIWFGTLAGVWRYDPSSTPRSKQMENFMDRS